MNSFFKLLFSLTFSEFKEKKLKTALTLSGIVVAVFTIVLLVILTLSLKQGVLYQLEKFGPNQVILSTSNVMGQNMPIGFSLFSESDVKYIENLKQVDSYLERLTLIMSVEYNDEVKKISITGVSVSDYTKKAAQADTIEGRFFNLNEEDKRVALLGYKVYKDSFSKTVDVKKKIFINNKSFEVIGVLEETGSLLQDSMIYVPIDSFRDSFGLEGVTSVIVFLKEGVDPNAFVDFVKDKLNRRIGKDVTEALTSAQLRSIIDNILTLINILIISIAAISMIVGSIGITNSLYSSVLQRKREIGTMKAVGAKNFQILLIFLFESIILSFIGVVVGYLLAVVLGFVIIQSVQHFSPYNLIFTIPLNFSIAVFLFSILLGVVSGLYPAYQATKLPPTEALRYE